MLQSFFDGKDNKINTYIYKRTKVYSYNILIKIIICTYVKINQHKIIWNLKLQNENMITLYTTSNGKSFSNMINL